MSEGKGNRCDVTQRNERKKMLEVMFKNPFFLAFVFRVMNHNEYKDFFLL